MWKCQRPSILLVDSHCKQHLPQQVFLAILSQVHYEILHLLCIEATNERFLITLLIFQILEQYFDFIRKLLLENNVNDILNKPALAKTMINSNHNLRNSLMEQDLGSFYQYHRSFLLSFDPSAANLNIII